MRISKRGWMADSWLGSSNTTAKCRSSSALLLSIVMLYLMHSAIYPVPSLPIFADWLKPSGTNASSVFGSGPLQVRGSVSKMSVMMV